MYLIVCYNKLHIFAYFETVNENDGQLYLFSLQTGSFNLTPLMEDPQNLQGKFHFWVPAAVDEVPLEGRLLCYLFCSLFSFCSAQIFNTPLLT